MRYSEIDRGQSFDASEETFRQKMGQEKFLTEYQNDIDDSRGARTSAGTLTLGAGFRRPFEEWQSERPAGRIRQAEA